MNDLETILAMGALVAFLGAGAAYWQARSVLAKQGAAAAGAWTIGWRTFLCCMGIATVAIAILLAPYLLAENRQSFLGSSRQFAIAIFILLELAALGLSLAAGAGALFGSRRSAHQPDLASRARAAAFGAACTTAIGYVAAALYLNG